MIGWKRVLGAAVATLAMQAALPAASVAQAPPRLWNVTLGKPVDTLPPEFIIQACGTNGGPPTTVLNGFEEYARCPVETATGLHEIWFSYDDVEEYFLRALRVSEDVADGARANTLFEQLVINSVLVDRQGLVQGFRIISDPRERPMRRMEADAIAGPLKNVVFGAFGWTCTDLPKVEGERPFRGSQVKEICKKTANGRNISVETHVYLKPGQQQVRVGEGLHVNEFEARVRVEVINAAFVRQ